MSNKPAEQFTLLTPVPVQHLISGIDTCDNLGLVTYGSNAVSRFSNFQQSSKATLTGDVLFYASHAGGSKKPMATYSARLEDWVLANSNGESPKKFLEFRPETTAGDKPWKTFYIVSNLKKLSEPIPIKLLRGKGKPDLYSGSYYPRGPMIIDEIPKYLLR